MHENRQCLAHILATLALLCALVAMPALAQTPAAGESSASFLQGPEIVGSEVSLTYESTAFEGAEGATLAWREEIRMPGASYIAPHFSHFILPAKAELVVRAPDGSRSWTYTGFGKADRPLKEGFWGIHIPGDTAIVEIHSEVPVPRGAVVIDRFAHGFPVNEMSEKASLDDPLGTRSLFAGFETKAICGSDDSDWAKCYQSSEPTIYSESRAVARLLINGTSACTGWLVGDQGHLMTNNHCIGSSSDALNTDYELMAEGSTCGTNCASFGACSGTVEATSATLIQTDANLDYTLVQLPTNITSTYGYMQLRDTGAVNGERIYIPGHPAAWGKRISVASTHASNPSGLCEVDSLNQAPCIGGSVSEVGYYCDTRGGSSGSPVLGYSDHCVVALHHCAYCQNRGVPIDAIINDLGGNLPSNALCDQSWTGWLDRDNASGSGDYETFSDFVAEGLIDPSCVPVNIECQTTGGVDWSQTGEVYSCDPDVGGVCVNSDQPDGYCQDYQVRFQCATWTGWLDRDNASGSGDYETLSDFLSAGQVDSSCSSPYDVECRTTGGVDWTQTGEVYNCSPSTGGVCVNSNQPDGYCQDYEVRFLCP